jgi:hypothetical protein
MHQQFPQAPFSPKSLTNSFQFFFDKDSIVSWFKNPESRSFFVILAVGVIYKR